MNVGNERTESAENPGSGTRVEHRALGKEIPRPDHRWMLWLIVIGPATAVAIVVTLSFLSAITGVLQILLFSEFIALALEPGVNWLARRGWRRGVATGVLMATIAVACIGVFLLILPTLISELAGLIADLPNTLADLGRRLGFDVSVETVEQALQNEQEALRGLAADVAGDVVQLTSAFLGVLGNISIMALLSFYLTAEAPKVRRTVLALLPRKQQQEVLRLWEIATDKIGGYLYSRALMGLLSGLASYGVLRLLGVPFAAPLAIFVGFVSQFVPAVGTYIAYALPTLVALGTNGLRAALILVGFGTLYQQLENLFISPRLSARTMQLHPAVAFVAAMIGGAVGGLSAAFLALPIAAIFQAFGSTFLKRYEVIESVLTQDLPISTGVGSKIEEEKGPLLKRLWIAVSRPSSK
jgi:predicted PurR-regulated permease PerM